MNKRTERRSTQKFVLSEYLPYYLAHILRRYDVNMALDLQRHGLNNSAWRVLSTLRFRDGLTIKELSRYTVLERSFVSRVAIMLSERGLVLREIPHEDRRNVVVSLTAAGEDVLQDIMLPIVRDQMNIAFDGVSTADRTHLIKTLSLIVDNVYRAAREAPPDL